MLLKASRSFERSGLIKVSWVVIQNAMMVVSYNTESLSETLLRCASPKLV